MFIIRTLIPLFVPPSQKSHALSSVMYRFLVTLWNNIPYTYYITTIIHKETTTIRMKPVLKKTLKIVAALVAIPIVIVVLLAVLLYVPPVQNWAVDQVAHYV